MNRSVKYITFWDGCDEVETSAKVNSLTGEVFDIELVDVDEEYETCEGEFVKYEDGSFEQVIWTEDNRYFIVSKSENSFRTTEIQGTQYTVLDEIEDDEIHRICGIAY